MVARFELRLHAPSVVTRGSMVTKLRGFSPKRSAKSSKDRIIYYNPKMVHFHIISFSNYEYFSLSF